MEKLTLCTPTILRYDLCDKLIMSASKGIIKPNEYKVLDNGNSYANKWHKAHPLSVDVKVISPKGNIGVSAAWNQFLRTSKGLIIIANDDICVFPDTIKTMIDEYYANKNKSIILFSLGGINAFSFYLIHSSIQHKIGYFDETFYPAYFEDNDYIRRMFLLGYKQKIVRKAKYIHYKNGSATLKEQRRKGIDKDHDKNFRRNKAYYIKKWGGVPGNEKFTKPFNK